jgi:hypothetical protein
MREIGDDCFRHPEALFSLRFGVLGIEQDVHSSLVELDVSAHRQGCKASATDNPEAEQHQHEPIPVLAICHLVYSVAF